MVLFKDFLPGSKVCVDYFGRPRPSTYLMEDVSLYLRQRGVSAQGPGETLTEDSSLLVNSNVSNNSDNIDSSEIESDE